MNKVFQVIMYTFAVLFVVSFFCLMMCCIWGYPAVYIKVFGSITVGSFLFFWVWWGGAMSTL